MELLLCVFIYTVRMRSTAVHSLTAVFRVLRLKSLCCPSLGQSCRMRGFNSEEDRSVTQCSPDHYCKSSSWCVLHAIYHAIMPSVVRIYIVEVCSILDKGDGMGGNLVCVELFPIIPNHIISYYKIPRMHFKSAATHF